MPATFKLLSILVASVSTALMVIEFEVEFVAGVLNLMSGVPTEAVWETSASIAKL